MTSVFVSDLTSSSHSPGWADSANFKFWLSNVAVCLEVISKVVFEAWTSAPSGFKTRIDVTVLDDRLAKAEYSGSTRKEMRVGVFALSLVL